MLRDCAGFEFFTAMNKEHIINEIRRTAKANGGVALGHRRFGAETGIGYHDWYGRFWSRWSDALREAGLEPNRMSEAYDDEVLLEKLALLTRRLGRVPIHGDLLHAPKDDLTFPTEKVFRRLGLKPQRISRMIAFCEAHPGYDDVAALWRKAVVVDQPQDPEEACSATPAVGYYRLGGRKRTWAKTITPGSSTRNLLGLKDLRVSLTLGEYSTTSIIHLPQSRRIGWH